MTTLTEVAAALNGAQYPLRIPKDVKAAARAAGILIIYGQSDDLMEFDGAFCDEIGAYDGVTAYLDADGVLDRGAIDDDDDLAIADHVIRARKAAKIEALWEPGDGYSWKFETDIPHETFEIEDDGEPYCRGIVLSIKDLPSKQ